MSAHSHRERPPADSHRRRDDRDDRSSRHHHSSRSDPRSDPRAAGPGPSAHHESHKAAPQDPPAPAPAPAAALPPPPALAKPAEPQIVRAKVCPLLLRVFHKLGGHHRLEEFSRVGGQEIDDEVQIYTWQDATLRELSDLVKEVQPVARRPTSRMGFALVYPDRRGHNVMRVHGSRAVRWVRNGHRAQVGQVHSSRVGQDDVKTLAALKFQTGDYLDVAVF